MIIGKRNTRLMETNLASEDGIDMNMYCHGYLEHYNPIVFFRGQKLEHLFSLLMIRMKRQ